MRLFAALRLLTLSHRSRINREMDEELHSHLQHRADDLERSGLSRAEAERRARIEFGGYERFKDESHDALGSRFVEILIQDLSFGLRIMWKNPGFALTTILTLALGIGSTTAIFSLINAVMLRPLPFPEQNRLVCVKQQDHSLPGVVPESLSYPDYFDWRAQNHTLSGLASYAGGGVTFEAQGESQRLDGQMVSANFFQVLGVAPLIGRDFRWADEKPGNRAVMLSYSLWRSTFGAAKDIAGRTIRLDDQAYTVAGVMPKDFQFPIEKPAPALWISLSSDAEGKDPKTRQRSFQFLDVIGRLKPGITLEQAKADLDIVAGNLALQYPDTNKWYTSALVEPELQHLIGDTKPALRVLFGAVALLLLISCTNVAGLLLARHSRRHSEFALRTAIGASRLRIIRQLLVESTMLSLCGGIAGVILAFGMLKLMVKLVPLNIPRMEEATIDTKVLVFVIFVSVLSGLLFGMLPAWRMSQLEPLQAMREGTRGMAGGRKQHHLHNGLVVAQTAIALILLVGSGLMLRSFIRILNINPGFDSANVVTARMRVRIPFDQKNHDRHIQFYQQLLTHLSMLPGVQAASAGWPLPMTNINAGISFTIAGRSTAKADRPSESIGLVMPDYFHTMRIPLLSGRTFGEQDRTNGQSVIIVSHAFAQKYFPGKSPIGKHIQVWLGDDVVQQPVREVVGVVGDIRRKGLTSEVDPQYYLPYAQAVITNPFIAIRTSGDPFAVEAMLRNAVHELDKGVPIYQVSLLDNYVSQSVAQPRFQAVLLTCFAGIALLLSAIGLYGLLSYLVAQRTLEIGLRMALGARKQDVLRTVLARGLALALIGLGAGLIISATMTRLLSGMLYGIRLSDPFAFTAAAGVLLFVSLAASYIPAYRATRVNPVEQLRQQ